ncbi:MAG: preprotein translocase subunit SecG [Acidobacteria bacterium]|nr:preprotein translocase subunit SecG [Acidobacteriota bacterium]
MIILLTIIHVLVCFFLVIVVLLQSGKAADLAGAFGGMGSQTAFGPRGAATVLSKATTIAAGLFMITSLTLSVAATRAGRTGSTVLERAAPMKKSGATTTPPAGGSTPIQINPSGGGAPTTVNVPTPVQTAPPAQQPPAAPAKK